MKPALIAALLTILPTSAMASSPASDEAGCYKWSACVADCITDGVACGYVHECLYRMVLACSPPPPPPKIEIVEWVQTYWFDEGYGPSASGSVWAPVTCTADPVCGGLAPDIPGAQCTLISHTCTMMGAEGVGPSYWPLGWVSTPLGETAACHWADVVPTWVGPYGYPLVAVTTVCMVTP